MKSPSSVLTEAFFIPLGFHTQGPSTDKCMKKMRYVYAVRHFAPQEEILPFAVAWTNPQEVSFEVTHEVAS